MDRRIVVTGGSSGIGRAIAAKFAADGDQVWITGRTSGKLESTAADLGVVPIRCDHTSVDDIIDLARQLPGGLDVLINAVGANTHPWGAMAGTTDLHSLRQMWLKGLETNLLSAVLTTGALLERFGAGGAIIAIGSEATESAATSYGAAKAALGAWTAGLSALVGRKGITVNTVTPNFTEGTDFYDTPLPEQMRDSLIGSTHTGRAGQPEDVAGAVHFLAGPHARHITAQTLHVSGGIYLTR
jgi:3-oxoacyl-[acyl-carrier protein] reductase